MTHNKLNQVAQVRDCGPIENQSRTNANGLEALASALSELETKLMLVVGPEQPEQPPDGKPQVEPSHSDLFGRLRAQEHQIEDLLRRVRTLTNRVEL